MPLPQLRRVRWAVRATLTLGVAASVVANVLHARDNPISQAIAAWPPLALLLTVELISRVPVHRRSLAFARMAATATIAGIAAWVSYWHMVGVAARYGETGASPYLLPLSVDGLIVVASICLVELGGRISIEQAEKAARAEEPAVATVAAPGTSRKTPRVAPVPATPAVPGSGDSGSGLSVPAARGSGDPGSETTGPTIAAARPRPAAVSGTPRKRASSGSTAGTATSARPRRPITETAALAAAIQAARPEASDADVAQELGITAARLRTIRRQVRELDLVA
ncbi:DUF2637 domain-containing protein [Plantactinospora soyae]|uniref:DUF2637 domain-containing protein n=1 Tax=Plantactinospora soyae TaxID=1544732 RepID=A0A927R7Q7_9ACTN|nr:DUF2637 domain-containing protein [Plantactinospora soyae]MBE1488086.1 hypothetical protein [Plantactinospora soyae]